MRFVQVKSAEQLINQARAFLLERGIAIPQGKRRFAARLPEILEDADNGLRDELRELLAAMLEWRELERKIRGVNKVFVAEAKAVEACRRLTGIPGVGAQTATAVVAAIDDGKAFETGRDCAAWLGLTPRESSTGGRKRLGRIRRQGNPCLHSLLVHCARSGLDTLSQRKDRLGAWLRRLLERNQTKKGRKVAIVALAARLARIMLAMLGSGQPFRPEAAVA